MMPETARILIPLLSFFVAPAGAAMAASWLFDQLRQRVSLPAPGQLASPLARLLWSPLGALYGSLVLAGLVSVVFTVPLAWLQGQPLLPALDTALAAAIGGIASQLWHRRDLARDVPGSAAHYVREIGRQISYGYAISEEPRA